MTLDQLLVFQRIVEKGSFRAASEDLKRAQSAVSYAVKTLESEMGFELFSRETYRPVLTYEGKAFFSRAVKLLKQASELECFGQQFSANIEPVFRVSVSSLLPMAPVAERLAHFREVFPNTDLHFDVETLSGEVLLMDQEVDLALVEGMIDQTSLETHRLGQITLPLVVGGAHPLMKHRGKVALTQLVETPQIILRSTRQDETARNAGIVKEAASWSVSDFESKKQLILHGLGWGRLPHHLIREELRDGVMKELKLEGAERSIAPLYLARRRRPAYGQVAEYLWKNLRPKLT